MLHGHSESNQLVIKDSYLEMLDLLAKEELFKGKNLDPHQTLNGHQMTAGMK